MKAANEPWPSAGPAMTGMVKEQGSDGNTVRTLSLSDDGPASPPRCHNCLIARAPCLLASLGNFPVRRLCLQSVLRRNLWHGSLVSRARGARAVKRSSAGCWTTRSTSSTLPSDTRRPRCPVSPTPKVVSRAGTPQSAGFPARKKRCALCPLKLKTPSGDQPEGASHPCRSPLMTPTPRTVPCPPPSSSDNSQVRPVISSSPGEARP
jgi:hypothetical protein